MEKLLKQVYDYIDSQKDAMVETLGEVVNIESYGYSKEDVLLVSLVKASQGVIDSLPNKTGETLSELGSMNMYGFLIGIIGFALLFIGMNMMQEPLSFLKERPDLLMAFGSHPFLAFMAGLVITLIVQSSSATVGLTMAVAAQGVIPLQTAIVIILGDNIGTTITAVIASLGANRSAKQAAAAHVMIKVLGTVVILMVLPMYTMLIEQTATTIVFHSQPG